MLSKQKIKYFGIIPARKGSKSIIRKNLKPILNKPLLQYTIEAAKSSKKLDYCILSSDDQDAIDLAIKNGIDAPFIRPSNLSDDNANSEEVVLHALQWFDKSHNESLKALVLLQPTTPFRTSEDIDNAIEKYENSGKDSLMSVCEVINHPSDCITINNNEEIEKVMPIQSPGNQRQNFKKVYFMDGSIYITSVKRFRKKLNLYDKNTSLHLIPAFHGIDIDEPFDLDLAKAIAFYSKNRRDLF
tara:strand:+ start:703 stop:1431 length:729 start_codon:yes stop_codon:yes gene_type:complete